jgi:hypothetical protein
MSKVRKDEVRENRIIMEIMSMLMDQKNKQWGGIITLTIR